MRAHGQQPCCINRHTRSTRQMRTHEALPGLDVFGEVFTSRALGIVILLKMLLLTKPLHTSVFINETDEVLGENAWNWPVFVM